MSEPAPASLPFWARCADCAHCWAAGYYPMELAKFMEIIGRAVCPKCGGKAMVAAQDEGKLLEESSPPQRRPGSPPPMDT